MPKGPSKPPKSSARKDKSPHSADKRVGGIDIGDRAHVHVEGDVAGRDIIKQTANKFEVRWWVVLLGVGAPLLLIAVFLLLPQIRGLGKMTRTFNIAVAEFGVIDDRGNVSSSEEASLLRGAVIGRLQIELEKNPGLEGIVEVRHENVGPVRGSTPIERSEAARTIRDNLNAHLVIYGYLEKQGSQTVFVPVFDVSDKVKGAEEIVGPNQLGSAVPLGGGLGGSLVLGDAMRARLPALAHLAIGLSYLVAGKPDDAVNSFEQAEQVKGWKDEEGKEVLYLWLGTAYAAQTDADALTKARAAYEEALKLNSEYARAYIGVGNTYYLEFSKSDPKDFMKLDQAGVYYEKASAAKVKPETALVDAKVHTSLGNVYTIKAQQPGGEEWYAKAENEYLQVVNQFERGSTGLKPLVAQVYLSLGIIQERWKQDYKQAAEYYDKGLATIEQNMNLKQDLEDNLKSVASKLGTPVAK